MRSKTPASSGATLAQVAALAGVSTITASRAMRGQGPMSEKTRQTVLKAAEALGYRRNPIAASLVSSSSNLVGVIVPSLTNIVFVDMLAGLNAQAATGGFRPLIGVSEYDPAEERHLADAFLGWRPAALILTGLDHDPALDALLRRGETRCIEVMDIGPSPIDIMIGFSHEEAGRLSAGHLWQRGYRRIGYVGHDLHSDPRAAKRHHAFVTALAQMGGAVTASEITAAPSGVENGRQALARLLRQDPQLDAVYFSNDDMAIGGMFHCLGAGIDVPGQLALMGFNALEIGQSLPRALTTIRTPRQAVGQAAGQAVLDLAAGRAVDTRQMLPMELVAGGTS